MKASFVNPLLLWYNENRRDLPWRHTSDPYRIYVSEIMLQQTRVEAVRDAYIRFLDELPDISSLACVPDDQLMKLWEGLGYYRRARSMKRAAEMINERWGGVFPEREADILELPGVGKYTAGAIGSIAFGLAIPAVDGNVLRVMARMNESTENVLTEKFQRQLQDMLRSIMESTFQGQQRRGQGNPCGDFNQALFELGATVCIPRGEPECSRCPVKKYCEAYAHGTVSQYPVRIKKEKRRIEKRTVLVITDGTSVAIDKRPQNGLLAGLYEFPNVEGLITEGQMIAYARSFGFDPVRIKPLGEARHLFSHVEWDMTGYEILVASAHEYVQKTLIFVTPEELADTYAVPSAFDTYLRRYKGNRMKKP